MSKMNELKDDPTMQWGKDFAAAKVERDELATELQTLYPDFASKIVRLLTRIKENNIAPTAGGAL